MSTHSTQSNHSTISTDSTGYGWTGAFNPFSVSSHSRWTFYFTYSLSSTVVLLATLLFNILYLLCLSLKSDLSSIVEFLATLLFHILYLFCLALIKIWSWNYTLYCTALFNLKKTARFSLSNYFNSSSFCSLYQQCNQSVHELSLLDASIRCKSFDYNNFIFKLLD